MIDLNYHHLYYFYHIAKEGSVSGASRVLYLAQPTLSAQLARFEKTLGRALFRREKRRLHLTDDGRRVLSYAESIFGLGRELMDSLRDRPRGHPLALQVGLMGSVGMALKNAFARQILALAPKVLLSVQEGPIEILLEQLTQQKLDIVLSDTPARGKEADQFSNARVGKMRMRLVASVKRWAKWRGEKNWEALPLVWPAWPMNGHHCFSEFFEEKGLRPLIAAEAQSADRMQHLCAEGLGAALVDDLSLSRGPFKNKLRVLPLGKTVALYESICLITRRRQWPHPLAKIIIDRFRPTGPRPA